MEKGRGFTLIEILIVIVIIGILATITLNYVSSARIKSRDAKRISDVGIIDVALRQFGSEHNNLYPIAACNNGTFSVDDDGLNYALTGHASDGTTANFGGTYLTTIPADPLASSISNVSNYYNVDYLYTTTKSNTVGTFDSFVDGNGISCTSSALIAANGYFLYAFLEDPNNIQNNVSDIATTYVSNYTMWGQAACPGSDFPFTFLYGMVALGHYYQLPNGQYKNMTGSPPCAKYVDTYVKHGGGREL